MNYLTSMAVQKVVLLRSAYFKKCHRKVKNSKGDVVCILVRVCSLDPFRVHDVGYSQIVCTCISRNALQSFHLLLQNYAFLHDTCSLHTVKGIN